MVVVVGNTLKLKPASYAELGKKDSELKTGVIGSHGGSFLGGLNFKKAESRVTTEIFFNFL